MSVSTRFFLKNGKHWVEIRVSVSTVRILDQLVLELRHIDGAGYKLPFLDDLRYLADTLRQSKGKVVLAVEGPVPEDDRVQQTFLQPEEIEPQVRGAKAEVPEIW